MSNLFKKWNSVKNILIILLNVLIFGSGQIKITHAADLSASSVLSDIASGTVYPIVYAISYLIGKIGGIFFTFAAFLVDLALRLNGLVLSSPIIQTGWQIVLNFTNLGFVLAIIVIAFATIFRVQSYAIKQTLWKLIVAALLVNFSLVIAGTLISGADTITNTFNKQFQQVSLSTQLTQLLKVQSLDNPFGGEAMSGSEKYSRVVLKMVDALNPTYWLGYTPGLEKIFWGSNKSVFTTDSFISLIGSLFFAVLFTFLSVFVMLTIAIMLFIRYIYLGFLLILSPIVWLLWIFPSTVNLWQKWWKNFLQWVFFAPIMMFFLFVAINSMNPNNQQISNADIQKSTTDAAQFSNNVAAQQTGLAVDLMKLGNMVIIMGLMMGSLIAAQSLSITGSKTAYGWAQKAGKGFGKWMGRESLEQTGGRIFASRLFKGGINEKGEQTKGLTEYLSSRKFPGVRFLGRGLNRLGVKTEETLQAEYSKLSKRMSPDELNYEIQNSRGSRRAVLLQEAAKRRDVDMDKLKTLLFSQVGAKDIKNEFNRTGLNYNDFVKTTGVNDETAKYAAQVEAAEQSGNTTALVEASKNLKEATAKLVKSIPLKDYSKGQWDDIFSKTPKAIKKALAAAFAEHENGAYSKITPQIKGKNMDNYVKVMDGGITEIGMSMDPELKKKALKADKRFHATLGRRAEFGEAWEPGAGTTTTTTTT